MKAPINPTRLIRSAPPSTIVAAAILLGLLLALREPLRYFAYPDDDGLAYGLIARNTANGMPFSFDGLGRTTGFHWGGLPISLVVAFVRRFAVGPATPADLFAWLYPVDCVVFTAAALLTTILIGHALQRRAMGVLTFVLVALALGYGFGMEAVLLPPLMLLQLLAAGHNRRWVAAAVATVTAVVRVDAAPAAVLIAAISAFRGSIPWLSGLSMAACAAAGGAAGLFISGGLNWLATGYPVSTAVLAKSYGASVLDPTSRIWLSRRVATSIFLALAVVVQPRYRTPALLAAAFGASAMWLQVAVTRALSFGSGSWYETSYLVLSLLPLLALGHDAIGAQSWTARTQRCVAGLIFGYLAFPRESPLTILASDAPALRAQFDQRMELGRRLRSATESEARIAVTDAPFAFMYFSNRRIIALDGPMNTVPFVRDYQAQRREAEFVRKHADYLVVQLASDGSPLVSSPDGRFHSFPLGLVGPFRKPLPVSHFSFTDDDVVFRLEVEPWEGKNAIWLVRVRR